MGKGYSRNQQVATADLPSLLVPPQSVKFSRGGIDGKDWHLPQMILAPFESLLSEQQLVSIRRCPDSGESPSEDLYA